MSKLKELAEQVLYRSYTPGVDDKKLLDDIEKLEREKWISVEDRLPEEGGRYWCYVEELNSLGKSYYQWNCGYNISHKSFVSDGTVTHWMPLPEPPR